MKKLYISAFLSLSAMVFSQDVKWQRNMKSSTQDLMSVMIQTIDGNFLLAGSSIQNHPANSGNNTEKNIGNNGYDYHIVKLNQKGNTVWEKFFSGTVHDYLNTAAATQEGGFILAGTSTSDAGEAKKTASAGGSDIWVIKTDENGAEQWQKSFGSIGNEEAKSVIQSSDLGYFIAGNVENHPNGYGSKDAYIIKLDKNGKEISEIFLGGKGLDDIQKIIPAKDGGCLVAIYSRSVASQNNNQTTDITQKVLDRQNSATTTEKMPATSNQQPSTHLPNIDYKIYQAGKSETSYGEGDYWIVKLDKNNQVQWQKSFGGREDDKISDLALTDEGFLIAGGSRSGNSGNKKTELKEGTDLWLVSLDMNGNELWQKSYSFKNRDILMSLNPIKNYKAEEGKQVQGFLLGGYTQAEHKTDENDEKFWMLYLNSKGEEQWRKYVEGASHEKEERLVSAVLTNNGDYVLAGTSAPQLGQENWKIVQMGDKQVKDLTVKKEISVYPNPVKDYCYVEIGEDFTEATIQLYDMTGKLVQQNKTTTSVTKLNTASLPQGIFIVNILTDKNKQYYATKIIKE